MLKIKITELTCKRCNHSWYPRHSKPPAVCPRCKSRAWDKPKRNSKKV